MNEKHKKDIKHRLGSMRNEIVAGEEHLPGKSKEKSELAAGIEDPSNMPNLPHGEREVPEKMADGGAVPQGHIPIYDVSGQQPVLGHIDPSEVTDAVNSGKFSLPQGSQIPVIDPNGQFGTMDSGESPEAFKNGYRYATHEEANQAKYGGLGQQVKAGLEGAAETASFGTSPALEQAAGIATPEDILGRRETGIGHTIGQIGGLLIPGSPEAEALNAAGKGATEMAGLAENAPGVLNGIKNGLVKAAVENGLFSTGDETSKMMAGDPNASLGSAAANIGMSALIGAGVGGALGAVSPIWKAAAGNKAGQIIEDFKGRMKQNIDNPDPVGRVIDELNTYYQDTRNAADTIYGKNGVKAKGIEKLMPEMSSKISDQTQEIADTIGKAREELKDDPYLRNLDRATAKWQSGVTDPNAKPIDIFNANQEFKQQLQAWGKYDKEEVPLGEKDFRDVAQGLAFDLRNRLENPDVWGDAAKLQQKVNKAFHEYLPALQDAEQAFTEKKKGERVISPGRIQTYMNQLGKRYAELKQSKMEDFLNDSEKYRKVIGDLHSSLGLDSPVTPSSLSALKDTLGEKSTGAKLADYVYNKGLNNTAAEALGAGVGGAAGHAAGGFGGFGAIIGEHALAPFFRSVLPILTKPMMDNVASAEGLKAAVDYGASVAKGDAALTKGVKNLFKAGREVLPASMMPTQKDRDQLDKQVKEVSAYPTKMLEQDNHLGKYLPDHSTAAAAYGANAVKTLAQLRPSNQPFNLPLDDKLKPSESQKQSYRDALNVAQQPLFILHRVKQGTITPQDVSLMKQLHPGMYNRMVMQMTNEVISAKSKGITIPYHTRLAMSLFLGQPMDSTMLPQSIIAAQPRPQNPQQQQAPTKPKKSTSTLGKLPNQYKTPGQAAEADSASKD